ncbi:MAG: tetratricopeptide repeat protein, partial [Planctomycetota bacterium]
MGSAGTGVQAQAPAARFSQAAFCHEVFRMGCIPLGRKVCSMGTGSVLLVGGALLCTATTRSAQPAADDPAALLRQGIAHRSLGLQVLAQAGTKPAEAAQLRAKAKQHFAEAAKQFAGASAAFASRSKQHPKPGDAPPAELESAACASCGQAEMELRTEKASSARETMEPLVKEPLWARSRYRDLALYYHGFACLVLKDYLAAGRSLNQITTFTEPTYGTHARYLLARVLHHGQEHPEAMAQYEGVLADYEAQKKQAAEALKQPDAFRNDPAEKTRLEKVVNAPPPDHVGRALFSVGLLYYEAGRFAEARTRFTDFGTQCHGSALRAPSRLFQGCCEVQLRQFAEAAQTLHSIMDHEPALARHALFWLAKAQLGVAEGGKEETQWVWRERALGSLRRAEKLAAAANGNEMGNHAGRMHLQTQKPREAVTIFREILDQRLLPGREEEVCQRRVSALSLAGDFRESDALAARFQEMFPMSSLLAEVVFRSGENAYFLSLAAEPGSILSSRLPEASRLNDLASARYQRVVDRSAEYPYANVARYALACARYRKGHLDKAREVLEAIPAPERRGELTDVPYLIADCLIRLAPATADDALAAGRLQEQLGRAIELLTAFAAEHPDSPLAADALLRLALCQQRLAGLMSQAEERAKLQNAARATYDRILLEFPLHELGPHAAFERAKAIARAGDANEAINRLRSFTFEPLAKNAIAPLANLELATLLRGQDGKAALAAQFLDQCLKRHEKALLEDKTRAAWLPLLHYHQGVALHEAGSFSEARAKFETVMRDFPDHPVALEAALRWGQSLRDGGNQTIERAGQVLGTADIKPAEAARAAEQLEEGKKQVSQAMAYFESKAKELQEKRPALPLRARLLNEAVWMVRAGADAEVGAARAKLQGKMRQEVQEAANKSTPQGQQAPQVPPPDVPLAKVELQPSEKKVRALYQAIIDSFPDLPLAVEARLELAELLAAREEFPAAINLLDQALDKEPPPDMASRIRLRLGMCH